MKLFVVILLSGYFLARERELFQSGKKNAVGLVRDWAVYMACSGLAVFLGMIPIQDGRFQPAVVLLAALIPAYVFQGRAVCAWAGAATAYCVLRLAPDLNLLAITLLGAEFGVFIVAFFYQISRERMQRLFAPAMTRGHLGALSLLFVLTVFLGLVWQKAIQIYGI